MTNIADKLGEQLNNKICSNFRIIEGGTLILYFIIENKETVSCETKLWIDCAWRVRDDREVLVGSLNNPDLILAELDKIKGLVLNHVEVDDITRDFRLFFSGNLTVEGFCYSTEDELWELRRSDGYRIGIGPMLKPFEKFEIPRKEKESD